MYFINPFKALRPTQENAPSVTIASTDHLSEDMQKNHLKKNPWSYLNVFNADNKKKSKEQFELMKEKSIITKDEKLSFYCYKISKENFKQVGIVGTANLTAYDNLHIRGHEEIFFERSQKRMKQMDNLNAQIGPIYAVYPDNKLLNDLVEKELLNSPAYSFEGMDGNKHEMWIVNDEKKPLINKSIAGLYSPGSTFKPLVALAALEYGTINSEKAIQCKGHKHPYELYGVKYHCWKKEGHGYMRLRNAIKQSCDIYFYEMARLLGVDKLSIIDILYFFFKKKVVKFLPI